MPHFSVSAGIGNSFVYLFGGIRSFEKTEKNKDENKVLATILFSLLVVPLVQSADNSPRLVVGITVDQLRTDYLEALQHLFGEKGFKRLMREGVVCENLVFDFPNIDKASATATLYTGTTPFFMVFRRSVFSIPHFCGKSLF